MITPDFNRTQELIALVVNDMLERYPDCRHTVRILFWDDGTSLVECRHARLTEKGMMICNSAYYKDKLKYHERLLRGDRIRIDGRGNEYNVNESDVTLTKERLLEL